MKYEYKKRHPNSRYYIHSEKAVYCFCGSHSSQWKSRKL